MEEKQKVVVVSGYFNPIHKGHVRLFKEAKSLGDKLVVIVNNDNQVKLKGSFPFMSEKSRVEVIKAIQYVDEVILSIDQDRTVRKTLAMLKPDIFANGGDRRERVDLPEAEVCKKYNIQLVFNVGGGKIQSSSWLIEKAQGRILNKEIPIEKLDKIKMLVLDSDGVCVQRGTIIEEKETGSAYELQISTGLISQELAERINRLKKKIIVCISSGRSLMYLQTVYSRIIGENTILIAENGNLVLHKGNISQSFQYGVDYFHKLGIIRNNMKHLAIKGFEPKQTILTAHADKELQSVYHIVDKIDKEKELRVMWNGEAFDIQRKNVNKGMGLEKLLKVLNIQKEEVIAIGDRVNDKELLDVAGIGVSADSNALKAEYWTKDNNKLPGDILVQYLLDYFEK